MMNIFKRLPMVVPLNKSGPSSFLKQSNMNYITLFGKRNFSTTGSKFVFDVTDDDFEEKVLKSQIPIIIDLHADWCGPCKLLGPSLEKAVNSHNGKVAMAKVDVDKNEGLSQKLRVQSLPTVMAVHKGKLLEQFVGMQPENVVNEFVQRVVDNAGNGSIEKSGVEEVEQLLSQSIMALDNKSATPEKLAPVFKGLADLNPIEAAGSDKKEDIERVNKVRAVAHASLVLLCIEQKDLEAAKTIASIIKKDFKLFINLPEIKKALASLKLQSDNTGFENSDNNDNILVSILKKRDAGNITSDERFQLVQIFSSNGSHEEAIIEGLQLIKKDRSFLDQTKVILLDIFEVLGPTNEIVIKFRRKLSNVLL